MMLFEAVTVDYFPITATISVFNTLNQMSYLIFPDVVTLNVTHRTTKRQVCYFYHSCD